MQMWHTAVNATERIGELKSGIPLGETLVLRDPLEALQKIEQMLQAAKRGVILITSSQSLKNMVKNDFFVKHIREGLNLRIMAPIDLDNIEAAKKLAVNCEVKHVAINYLTMMLIDDTHLFMFKTPPTSDLTDDSIFYVIDTFYTNAPRFSDRVSEMLNDTWKRGIDLSEINLQAGIKLPTVAVSKTDHLSKIVKAVL